MNGRGTGVHYKWTPERLEVLRKIYERTGGDIQRTAILYGLDTDRIRRGLVKLGILKRMFNPSKKKQQKVECFWCNDEMIQVGNKCICSACGFSFERGKEECNHARM